MMNSRDRFGEVIARPMNRLTLRADVHAIHLADARDLWYSGEAPFSRKCMNLPRLVLLLRRVVRRPLRHTQSRPAGLIAAPGAHHEPQWRKSIRVRRAWLCTGMRAQELDDAHDTAKLEHAHL
jgi:hypothetical protein